LKSSSWLILWFVSCASRVRLDGFLSPLDVDGIRIVYIIDVYLNQAISWPGEGATVGLFLEELSTRKRPHCAASLSLPLFASRSNTIFHGPDMTVFAHTLSSISEIRLVIKAAPSPTIADFVGVACRFLEESVSV
jgi:hypothetical protein